MKLLRDLSVSWAVPYLGLRATPASTYAGPGVVAGTSCQPPRQFCAATSPGGTSSRAARKPATSSGEWL